ncbi:MAG: Maf family protein [Acetobacteraceae bacterium]|nr:Maf family protein [Acetobacteraceae bacterium]
MALIYLASASPRRRELLRLLGLRFRVLPSRAEESVAPPRHPSGAEAAAAGPCPAAPGGDEAAWRACYWAERKARDTAARLGEGLVVGADTVVAVGAEVLGKPSGPAEAEAMLRKLSGRHHRVITGVAVVDAATGRSLVECEETLVWFRPLDPAQIKAYVGSGEPLGKAGAYAIQGRGGALVERVSGCYTNVVGLPLTRLASMLRRFGVGVPEGTGFAPAPAGAGPGGAWGWTAALNAAPSRIFRRRRDRGRGC